MAVINDSSKQNTLHTFEELQEKYFVYITNKESREKILKAYEFAKEKHKTQYRKSGEPYIHHLIEVTYILAELQCGPSTLVAGLLHDVVEDTNTSLDDIREMFGEDVTMIVDSLTKIQRMKLSHRKEEDFVAEDHRKIFLGMAKDVRVILIKLADRLHNMRTLDSLSKERQHALAKETLEVFVPIAHRLGINTIKSELEDLSLKYLEPEKYNEITRLLDERTKNRAKSLESLQKRIADILFEHKIPFTISSRVKSIYSIYRKMYQKNHKFDEIYDVLALRIITDSELRCYEILGIIHATYSPIPGRFKDYIAMPKPNMYQSLHTSIISGDGNVFEVQIRTKEMDEVAEGGVAAHWRYKEGSNYNPKAEQKEIESKLHWLRDLVTLSEEDYDAKEYMNSLSHDIFEANVYVFTPMGKVVDLPAGATPLDFAYKIHTRVGDQAVGAIVNGTMVSLNTVLKTGDVVEIKTQKDSEPNEGWLKIATTNFALAHIRKALAKKNADFVKDQKIAKGKQACEEGFKAYNIGPGEMEKYINDEKVFSHFGVENLDQLYIMISNKNPTPGAIIEFLNIKPKKEFVLQKVRKDDSKSPVYVEGAGKIAITLGSCCTPIPGDEIVGYITKGKGVTVHRKDCPNVANLKTRLIPVHWKDNLAESTYPVDLKIDASDRNNLLADIISVFNQKKAPLTAINAHYHSSTLTTTVTATIYVKNADNLRDIIDSVKNVNSVLSIERVTH